MLSSPCRGYSSAAAGSLVRDCPVASLCTCRHVASDAGAQEGVLGLPAVKDCSARILGMVLSAALQSAGKFRVRSTLVAGSRGIASEPLYRGQRILYSACAKLYRDFIPAARTTRIEPRLDVVLCRPSVTPQAASCQYGRQTHTLGWPNQIMTDGSELQIPVAPVATASPEEVTSIAQRYAVGHAAQTARRRHTLKTWLNSPRDIRKNQ